MNLLRAIESICAAESLYCNEWVKVFMYMLEMKLRRRGNRIVTK